MIFLFAGALAQAANVAGTVTDKTTGKPAAGDAVVLVEPMTGMSEVGRTTTDAQGRYTLTLPGNNPFLVRVTHQGADYFVSVPQGGGPTDIPVYDVAAKVRGVHIDADVTEVETANGQLNVDERYFIHNGSSPPITQWSKKSFSVVLPAEATGVEAGAQRPGGLPTSIKLDPDGPKGHYSFNFPIQPDDGDKETMFQITYSLPYAASKFSFKSQVTLPADNVAVMLPESMSFTGGAGTSFKSVNADPGVQTFLAKNVAENSTFEFTVSGSGAMPRQDQGAQGDNGAQAGGQNAGPGNQPGGGIGEPINTPDPLSKYKWWILGGLALLLAAAAAFLLRKPATAGTNSAGTEPAQAGAPVAHVSGTTYPAHSAPAKNAALLNALKEELFALESEKIAGTLPPDEYAEQKAALEIVLKRALKHSS